ncbi:GNAT family N-acetyltransferase [Achromobacter xylosoxidans]|uniref:GNAT family N-acetyltransferase n=1 Tax=Alcaligenes xylosoxydans xylosoxydans TaxID=85698 RepID=UPI0015CD7198|nr:GNAT family N-acetyltransferase [Achromobacter xylosoxidans]NYS12222.1 GNAT family N-acetyltransferase [Achromobacter xylosoxidans]
MPAVPDLPDLPALDTRRLLLRPLSLDDAPAIQRIFPQWEVVRYLAAQVPWPYPEDGARTYVEQVALPAMRRGMQWHWSLRPRAEPQRLIGIISLMRDEPGNNRGFWLDPEYRGQGYMTEASEAVTAYWFDVLGQPVLRAPKAAANEGSRRLSERTGMRLVATEERGFVSGRQLAEIWEITRDEWRARHPPAV